MTSPDPLVMVAVFSGAHRESRRRRDAAIVAALAAGARQDDVAAAAVLSAPAIRKIRDEARRVAETGGDLG